MDTMFKELEESSKEVDKEWEKLEETKSRVMSGIEERHKILNQLLSNTFEELERDNEEFNKREAEIRKQQEEISSMLDDLLAD